MARKKRKSSRRRSRRRMGAVGKANLQATLGIIAGAVAGRLVAKKLLPNVDEKIKNAGVVVLGMFFPKLMKGETGKAIGNGMIAAGGAGLVGSFVPGLGAVADDVMEFPVTVGEVPDTLSVIAGDDVMAGDDLAVMAGMDGDDDDY